MNPTHMTYHAITQRLSAGSRTFRDRRRHAPAPSDRRLAELPVHEVNRFGELIICEGMLCSIYHTPTIRRRSSISSRCRASPALHRV